MSPSPSAVHSTISVGHSSEGRPSNYPKEDWPGLVPGQLQISNRNPLARLVAFASIALKNSAKSHSESSLPPRRRRRAKPNKQSVPCSWNDQGRQLISMQMELFPEFQAHGLRAKAKGEGKR